MTLGSAIAVSPIPLYRPDSSSASDDSLVGIWVRTAWLPEVFFRYASGLEVSVRRADFAEGFKSFYEDEIEQGYPGNLFDVDGTLVFVSPGNTGQGAYLDMVLNSMLVQIVGKSGETEEDLIELGRSVIDRYASQP